MASNTDIELRKSIIYSAFIRNHTKEGTFRSFEKDLDRIKALGTDIIWLLPIHPIGVKKGKYTFSKTHDCYYNFIDHCRAME